MKPELKTYIGHLLNAGSKAQFTTIGGGSINQTYRVTASNKTIFCKINSATKFPFLFAKEARGLQFLQQTNNIATPKVLGVHEYEGHQILLLEWIEPGIRTNEFWKNFGESMAKLHAIQQASFGFEEDNYMGALPQSNTFTSDWCIFFRDQRLKPQVALAGNAIPPKMHAAFENLFQRLPDIFAPEPASLLHGDLWSGNFLCNQQSEPVLIDPAVYFGHKSIDLGMTTLFGGFDKAFYDSYEYWSPLPANYHEQWEVCNLYPLLIHLNLFGSSYLSSIAAVLRRFD